MSANSGIGPTLIIWCTIGVSGMPGPGHPGDPGRQTPQQIAHVVGLDVARLVAHPADPPPSAGVDAEHLGARQHPQRAELLGPLPHQRPGPQRVDHADGREVGPAKDRPSR